MKSVKVICPVHNEELSLRYFHERYSGVRDQLSGRYQLDLIFINNASTDGTLALIKSIREKDPTVHRRDSRPLNRE